MLKKFLITISIIIAFIIIYFTSLAYKMYEYSHMEVPENADYIIVLGAKTPSLTLDNRVRTAITYLQDNPNCIAILSGGQGPDEIMPEAEAMKIAMVQAGIDESRLILEDQSTSTKENLLFSKNLLSTGMESGAGLIVTSDFHVYRAVKLAEQLDLNITGLPSETSPTEVVTRNIREYLAITQQLVLNI